MVLSVTDLTLYDYCARKLFLQLVLDIKEPPSKHLVLGKILHNFIEEISKREESFVRDLHDFVLYDLKQRMINYHSEILKEIILKNQYELKSFDLDLAETYKNFWGTTRILTNERLGIIYDNHVRTGLTGINLWHSLKPKMIPEFKISAAALNLKGRIDQIEDYGDYCFPVELKSGKAPASGAWKNHQLQLAAYALLLESKFKKPVNKGIIIYLASNTRIEQPINPFYKEIVKDLIKKVEAILQQDETPDYVNNKNKCSNCGIKEQCYNEKLIKGLLNKRPKITK